MLFNTFPRKLAFPSTFSGLTAGVGRNQVGHDYGLVDVVADVVGTNQFVDSGMLKRGAHVGLNARKNDVNAIGL